MKRIILSVLFLALQASVFAQNRQKVIFDCDLAGDVDDAYALALLLSHLDSIEVLGIVTDHGLTKDRALVAGKILDITGLNHIPVYIGRETRRNLSNETGNNPQPYDRQLYWAKGYNGLVKQEINGADFIIKALIENPGEVTLITLGPVPNIGDVLKKEPGVLKLAKAVVCMAGSFYSGYNGSPHPSAEYNILEDLEASKMLLNAGANLTYIGLDVTDHIKLNEAERQQLFMRQTPLTDAVSALYALWRGEWGKEWVTPTLYDVVAVAYVIWPDLFKTRQVYVEIDKKGFTKIIPKNNRTNCTITTQINEEEFMKRFMHSLLTQNLGTKN